MKLKQLGIGVALTLTSLVLAIVISEATLYLFKTRFPEAVKRIERFERRVVAPRT